MDLKLFYILFLCRCWVYVMYCFDLLMRIFSVKFYLILIIVLIRIVLSLVYNEVRDEIIIGIVGGIMMWRFLIG